MKVDLQAKEMIENKVLIIAEAGVNHNGSLDMAKQLIDKAALAGADLVKFQTFNTDRLVTHSAKKADYQRENTNAKESQYEMLSRLELTEEMHHALIAHCKESNIGFFSTGFDIESIDFLMTIGQDLIKIPSGEITNLPYLRHIGKLKKKVILSTGMSTLEEVGEAIKALEDSGLNKEDLTVLHCTTEYPTPMIEVNLRAMNTIQQSFGVKVGYSDHTNGVEVAIAATAMGAAVIEKHFTLDNDLPGPDHKASLEPEELKNMISAIRNVEKALGSNIKGLSKSEFKNLSVARKSIVANKKIVSGESFTVENITVKRPGTGLSGMLWDDVIGKKAFRDFDSDELIELP